MAIAGRAPLPVISDVRVTFTGGVMRINNYEFLSFIGRGSYAEVVLAKHIETGKLFAVKCFSKSRLLKKRGVASTAFLRPSAPYLIQRVFVFADIRRVSGKMVVITGLDKVQVCFPPLCSSLRL
jgi:serine/threonine protein kinase